MSSPLFRGHSRNDPRVAIMPRQPRSTTAVMLRSPRRDIFKVDKWTGGQRKLAATIQYIIGVSMRKDNRNG